jgi:hypothetical protein
MSDDPSLRGPGSDPDEGADGRDERLAALLAVAPLEDHTRARLVGRALDAAPVSSPGRRRRALLLSAAAALLVIVVTGAAILATSGGGQTSRAARRAAGPTPVAGPQAGVPGPGSAAQVAPRDLGAVGDVTDAARLRQVVAGPASATGRSLDSIRPACGPGGPGGPGGAAGGVTRVDTVGTAVDAGQPAAILVGRDGTGRRVAVVVALHDCSVLQRLPLG